MTEPLSKSQVLEILQSRASTYSFLSRVYREELTPALLAELVQQMAGEATDEAESEGYRTLREYAAKFNLQDLESEATDLAAEYAALFLNMSEHPVFPFESVYTSPERLLMQEARDQVVAEYREEGLDRTAEFREPEDHLALSWSSWRTCVSGPQRRWRRATELLPQSIWRNRGTSCRSTCWSGCLSSARICSEQPEKASTRAWRISPRSIWPPRMRR